MLSLGLICGMVLVLNAQYNVLSTGRHGAAFGGVAPSSAQLLELDGNHILPDDVGDLRPVHVPCSPGRIQTRSHGCAAAYGSCTEHPHVATPDQVHSSAAKVSCEHGVHVSVVAVDANCA